MKIIKKGILTSYQDLGKNGYRHLGINPSGAMDKLTVRLLNILLQNDENEPVLEIYFPAPEILFEEDCIIAIGGADFMPMIDNQVVTNWKCVFVKTGSVLKFKRGAAQKKLSENITYLAKKTIQEKVFLAYLGNSFERHVSNLPGCIEIRIISGNEYQFLTEKSKQYLENQAFMISKNSNRMGFRMESEPLELVNELDAERRQLVSSAVDFGTIQLLPNGQIIILMADHQTSGGYSRIGNVISIDLHILAQCGANDLIKFQLISTEKAEELLILQEKEIKKLKASIEIFQRK